MCWFLYSSLVTGNIEQLSTPLPLFLSNAFDSSHSSPLLLIVKSLCLWRAKSFISNCSLSTYLLTQLRCYLLTYLPTHQSHHSKCHFSQWTMPNGHCPCYSCELMMNLCYKLFSFHFCAERKKMMLISSKWSVHWIKRPLAPIRTTPTETELSTCNHIKRGPIGQTHPNNSHRG